MPRQRRRRRRHEPRRSRAAAPDLLQRAADPRPWWKPTLGVVVAFSAGLWLGGTLSVVEVAGGAALILGALGVGMGGARLLGRRLRERRAGRLPASPPPEPPADGAADESPV